MLSAHHPSADYDASLPTPTVAELLVPPFWHVVLYAGERPVAWLGEVSHEVWHIWELACSIRPSHAADSGGV
jgi:hypothetical protein